MERKFKLVRAEIKPSGTGRKQESKRQKTLQRELEWCMSPKARKQSKGKARLNAYEKSAERRCKAKRRETRNIYS